jgi:hypothetical protein
MDSVWPERKRCRKCRRYFGPLVLDGKFCSYHCAGHDVPSIDPADWPRGHRRWDHPNIQWVEKVPYLSEEEALRTGHRVRAYRCGYCLMWHRATVRPVRLTKFLVS